MVPVADSQTSVVSGPRNQTSQGLSRQQLLRPFCRVRRVSVLGVTKIGTVGGRDVRYPPDLGMGLGEDRKDP
jgi:hypothetical protein